MDAVGKVEARNCRECEHSYEKLNGTYCRYLNMNVEYAVGKPCEIG